MSDSESDVVGTSKPRLLSILGPGLITGASDDDPSGIATYSQVGARFGYTLAWTMIFSYPLMCAVQMIAARLGRTTGHGIAGNLVRHYPKSLAVLLLGALAFANIVNLGADIGAMGAAVALVLPGPVKLYILAFGGLCIALQVTLAYARYVKLLKWLTLALFAYIATLFMVHVDWSDAASGLLLPRLEWHKEYLTAIVALLGTTISPYLFFWQSAQEAEDIAARPSREPLKTAPEQGKAALRRIELDTLVGMGFSNVVALAIIVTAAATLHHAGISNIETSAQAAEALKPLGGEAAFGLFALGIIGTGLLAVPVLAGSVAYAIGEVAHWPIGMSRQPREAIAFYGTVAAATALGVVLNFLPIDPMKALYWSAVMNGIVAVPVMVMMMLMAARTKIMGEFAINGVLYWTGWLSALVMAFAVVVMVSLWLLP